MRGTLPVCALAIIFLLTKTTLGQSGPNIARGRPAVQSSEDPSSPYPAGLAVDGSTNQNLAGGSCARTDPVQKPAWWRVDLGRLYDVGLVRIYNRGDCCGEALDGFTVYIGEEVKGDASATHQTTNCGDGYVSAPTTGQIIYATCLGAKGRYVWIYNPSGNLTLCEVQIYEYEPPPTIGRLRNVSSYPGGVGGNPRGDLGRRHNRYFYYSSGHYIYRADFVYGGTMNIAGWYYGYSNSDGRYSRFRSPQGIAVNEYTTCNNYYSPCTNIYVADYSNHVIRRVEATGWSRSRYTRVYTQAGTGGAGCRDGPTGTSQFYYPTDVSYYNSRIYVADQYCNRIRRIYNSVQSVAGSGTSGYADGPGTAAKLYRPTAVDVWRTGTNGVVYIVEQASHRIRQWDGATNVVTTVGGGSGAGWIDGYLSASKFSTPIDVGVDSYGHSPPVLYVGETGSNQQRIRAISLATGVTYTVAGVGPSAQLRDGYGYYARFKSIGSVKVLGSNRRVIIHDAGNSRFRYLRAANGDSPSRSPTTLSPTRTVAPSAAPTQRLSIQTEFLSQTRTVLYTPGNPTAVTGSRVANDTFVYFFDTSRRVYSLNKRTGARVAIAGSGSSAHADGPIMSCRFTNGISDLAIDPVNPERIYAVAQDQHRVRVIDRARQTVDTIAGSGSSGCTDGIYLVARFSNPREVVVTRPGILEYTDLYVSDYSCRKIRRVEIRPRLSMVYTVAGTGSSGTVDGEAAFARFTNPYGLAYFDMDDARGPLLWVTDYGAHTVRQWNMTSQNITTVAGIPGTTGYRDGNATTALFRNPRSITADVTRWPPMLYLTETGADAHYLRSIDLADGQVYTVAGIGTASQRRDGFGHWARFNNPYSIWFDFQDTRELYVADYTNRAIRAVFEGTASPTTAPSTISPTSTFSPTAVPSTRLFAYREELTDVTTVRYYSSDSLSGVALVDNRTAYVSSFNNRIYTLDLRTGSTTRVAGHSSGHAGAQDGTLSGSRFNQPSGMYVDTTNTSAVVVYIADTNNNKIRRLNLNEGTVDTVAGSGSDGCIDGIYMSSRFKTPYSIEVHRPNMMLKPLDVDVYVSDAGCNRIRKVEIRNTSVTVYSFAGTGASGSSDGGLKEAKFKDPRGLTQWVNHAFPAQLMLYTTECGQNTIRQINATSKNVTTVAGTPNTAGNRDGAFSTALFSCPQAVAADVSRETPVLYVSERGTDSHYIRSVDFATGETYNVAGIGTASQRRDGWGHWARFNNPGELAFTACNPDCRSALYVADYSNKALRMITGGTATPTTSPTTTNPTSTVSPTANPTTIRLPFDERLSNMTRLGGTTPGYPRWLTLGEMSRRLYMTTTDNKVYVVDTVNETFKWLAGQGSASNIDGVLANARFNDLRGLHADTTNASDVRIYVADRNNNKVRRININQGTVDTVAGSGSDGCVDGIHMSSRFRSPIDVFEFRPDTLRYKQYSDLYITDFDCNSVRKLEMRNTSYIVYTYAGKTHGTGYIDGNTTTAKFDSPAGIEGWRKPVDDTLHLYLVEYDSHTVRYINVDTSQVTTVAGVGRTSGYRDGEVTQALFRNPYGLTVDVSRTVPILYVTEIGTDNHYVRSVDMTTLMVQTVAGIGTASQLRDGMGQWSRLSSPQGAVFDSRWMQRLYIADYSNRAVRIIEGSTAAPTSNPTTVSPTYTTSPTLSPSSRGAAFENSVSNVTTVIPFVESGYPRWVAIGENINTMYITTTANKIFRVNIFNKTQTLVAGISNNGGTDGTTNIARFNDPRGLDVDYNNASRILIYVADRNSHKIRRVDVNQGTVDTVAGSGSHGCIDGLHMSARFYYPIDVIVDHPNPDFSKDRYPWDTTTNVYVGDAYCNKIRLIQIRNSSRIVYSFAGTGTSGAVDGNTTMARFNRPSGIDKWRESSDRLWLYVVDEVGDTVRAIDVQNREVTTLAGLYAADGYRDGRGTLAWFRNPYSITVDRSRTVPILYVAEIGTDESFIRTIDLLDNSVHTVAGIGTPTQRRDGVGHWARFSSPQGIAFDSQYTRKLFVCDYSNRAVRTIQTQTFAPTLTPTTVTPTRTVAPSAAPSGRGLPLLDSLANVSTVMGYSSSLPRYAAMGENKDTIYVVKTDERIYRVHLANDTMEFIAGYSSGNIDGTTTRARFNDARGLAVDYLNASRVLVYVADRNNHKIRRVNVAEGTVDTVAGSGSHGCMDGLHMSARFYRPTDVALYHPQPDDSKFTYYTNLATDIYVADEYCRKIRRIEIRHDSRLVYTAAGTGVYGLVDGRSDNCTLRGPTSLDIFESRSTGKVTVFFLDFQAQSVRQLDVATDNVTTISGNSSDPGHVDGPTSLARFNKPYSLALDATRDPPILYISEHGTDSHYIRSVDMDSRSVRTVAGIGTASQRRDGVGHWARFSTPLGVMFDSDHTRNLYVTDYSNGVVRVIHGSQTASPTIAPSTLTPTRTLAPTAAPSGRGIAYEDSLANVTTVAKTAEPPKRLLVSETGNELYVTQSYAIYRMDVENGTYTRVAGNSYNGARDGTLSSSTFQDPLGMELDYLNRSRVLLYVADSGAHKIRRVDFADGYTDTIAGSGSVGYQDGLHMSARFDNPMDVTLYHPNPDVSKYTYVTNRVADIYVADRDNRRIRRIEIRGTSRIVYTAAGNGNYAMRDGNVTTASFQVPQSIEAYEQASLGGKLFLYIVDRGRNSGGSTSMGISSVRCIDVAAGNVTTIAGFTGQQGHMDGVATVAQFWEISSLAVDHTRDPAVLYMVEDGYDAHYVRSLDLNGQVTFTVAGIGTATQLRDGTGHWSRFNNPFGIAFDSQYTRSVYIADYSNYAVRSIRGGFTKAPTVSPTTINPTITQTPSRAPTGRGYSVDDYVSQVRTLASGLNPTDPRVMAVCDDLGLIYYASQSSPRVAEVNIVTGAVRLIGGAGSVGGRDGSLTSATFGVPAGLDIDCWNTTQPYLYLADDTQHKIRRLNMAQGTVDTICGSGQSGYRDGLHMSARFNRPKGLVVRRLNATDTDAFIIDSSNARIRKLEIRPTSRLVYTAAGSGGVSFRDGAGTHASFYSLQAVVLADFGADTLLYIADSVRVRELNLTSMVVNTLVGAGISSSSTAHIDGPVSTAKFSTIKGLAVDATRDAPFVYLSECANANTHYIRGIDLAERIVTTTAGIGTQAYLRDGLGHWARFDTPWGLTFRKSTRTLYIADSGNNALRYIEGDETRMPTAAPSTVSPTATRAPSTAPSVRGIPMQNTLTSVDTVIHMAGIGFVGVELGAAPDTLYTSDNSYRIRVVNTTSKTASVVAGSGSSGSNDGPLLTARFNQPRGLSIDNYNTSQVYLYVADAGSRKIRRIDFNEKIVDTLAGSGLSGCYDGLHMSVRFQDPSDVAVHRRSASDVDIYIADSTCRRIKRLEIRNTSRIVHNAAGSGSSGTTNGALQGSRFIKPTSLALWQRGNSSSSLPPVLFVVDNGAGDVRRVDMLTQTVTKIAGYGSNSNTKDGMFPNARFDYPWGIAIDPTRTQDAFIYVTQQHATRDTNFIRSLDTATMQVDSVAGIGTDATLRDGAGAEARFYDARGVVLDTRGSRRKLYVADELNRAIRVISYETASPTQTPVTLVPSTTGTPTSAPSKRQDAFRLPYSLIRTHQGLPGSAKPRAVKLGRTAATLYVTASDHNIYKLSGGIATRIAGASGYGNTDGPVLSARFNGIEGFDVDLNAGSQPVFYVADKGNKKIRRVDLNTGITDTVGGTTPAISDCRDGFYLSARFKEPTDVALDANAPHGGKDLYVSDYMCSNIRRIEMRNTSILVYTLQNSGVSRPRGLALLPRPSPQRPLIFFADFSYKAIRSVDGDTRATANVCGGSGGSRDGPWNSAAFASPYGVTVDLSRNPYMLYITDGQKLRSFDKRHNTVYTVGGKTGAGYADGTTEAMFDLPMGLAIDSSGWRNVYVADYNNAKIRRAEYDSPSRAPTITYNPTVSPTSESPTTGNPTTCGPTTCGPTTFGPTTLGPTTCGPTTCGPTTCGPTTDSPTQNPTTCGPTTCGPTTCGPTTCGPTTCGPTTCGPTTCGPTSCSPTTRAPTIPPLPKARIKHATPVYPSREMVFTATITHPVASTSSSVDGDIRWQLDYREANMSWTPVSLSSLALVRGINSTQLVLPAGLLQAGRTYRAIISWYFPLLYGPHVNRRRNLTAPFTVSPSPLVAAVVGASRKSHLVRMPLKLDATASEDPDRVVGAVHSYAWNCTRELQAGCPGLPASVNWTSTTLQVPADTLTSGTTYLFSFVFKVSFRWNGAWFNRTAWGRVTVDAVQNGIPVDVNLTIYSARMRRRGSVIYVPAGVPASLETLHYFNITTSTRLVYRWLASPALERKAEFTKPSLALAPGLLRSGVQYAFRLLVSDGSTGYAANASQLVVVLEPPVISSVGGAPLSGVAWRTTFVLNASAASVTPPIEYAFGYINAATAPATGSRGSSPFMRMVTLLSLSNPGVATPAGMEYLSGFSASDQLRTSLPAGAHKIVVTARDSMGSAASRLSNETYVAEGRSITYPPGLPSDCYDAFAALEHLLDVVPDNATGATPTSSRDMCFRANQLLQFIENGEADRVMRIIEEAGPLLATIFDASDECLNLLDFGCPGVWPRGRKHVWTFWRIVTTGRRRASRGSCCGRKLRRRLRTLRRFVGGNCNENRTQTINEEVLTMLDEADPAEFSYSDSGSAAMELAAALIDQTTKCARGVSGWDNATNTSSCQSFEKVMTMTDRLIEKTGIGMPPGATPVEFKTSAFDAFVYVDYIDHSGQQAGPVGSSYKWPRLAYSAYDDTPAPQFSRPKSSFSVQMWNMSAGSGLSACRPSDVTRYAPRSKIYRVSTSGPIGRNASNPYIPDPSRNITIYFPLEPIGVDGEGDPTYDEGEGLICMWWDFYKNIWNETGCYYQPADQYYNASCGCRFMVSTVGAFRPILSGRSEETEILTAANWSYIYGTLIALFFISACVMWWHRGPGVDGVDPKMRKQYVIVAGVSSVSHAILCITCWTTPNVTYRLVAITLSGTCSFYTCVLLTENWFSTMGGEDGGPGSRRGPGGWCLYVLSRCFPCARVGGGGPLEKMIRVLSCLTLCSVFFVWVIILLISVIGLGAPDIGYLGTGGTYLVVMIVNVCIFCCEYGEQIMRETSKHMKRVARRLDPEVGRRVGKTGLCGRVCGVCTGSGGCPGCSDCGDSSWSPGISGGGGVGDDWTCWDRFCLTLCFFACPRPGTKGKKQGSKKKNNNKNGKTGSKKKKTAREEAKDDLKKETAEDRKQAEEQARREAMGATGAGEFKDGLQEDADAFKEGFDDEMPEDPRGCFREWIYSCLGCEPDDELDFDLPDACCGAGLFMPGRGCGVGPAADKKMGCCGTGLGCVPATVCCACFGGKPAAKEPAGVFKAACFGAGLLCLGAGCCASCYRPPVEDGKSGGGDNKQNLPPGDTRTGCCGSGMGCIATTLCCACFGGRPVEGADAATMASSACFGAGICGSGAGCCVGGTPGDGRESGVGCLEAIVCCACGAQGSADPEATEVAGNHACFGAGLCGPGLGFCGGAKEGLAIGCCSSGLGCALTALFCACFGGRPGSKQATPMCEAACFGAGLCGTGPGCCAGIDEDQVDGPTGPGGCCRSGQGCLATTLCLACGGGEGKGARGVCSAACCGAWGDGCCSGGEQGAGFFESILCFACGAGRTAPSGHRDHDGGEFVRGDQKAVLAKAAKNRACCGAGLCFAGPGCCGGPTDDTIGCCASGFGCLGTILCCACGAGVADASGYRPSKLGKAACCGGVAAGCKCSTPGKADLAPEYSEGSIDSKDADEQLPERACCRPQGGGGGTCGSGLDCMATFLCCACGGGALDEEDRLDPCSSACCGAGCFGDGCGGGREGKAEPGGCCAGGVGFCPALFCCACGGGNRHTNASEAACFGTGCFGSGAGCCQRGGGKKRGDGAPDPCCCAAGGTCGIWGMCYARGVCGGPPSEESTLGSTATSQILIQIGIHASLFIAFANLNEIAMMVNLFFCLLETMGHLLYTVRSLRKAVQKVATWGRKGKKAWSIFRGDSKRSKRARKGAAAGAAVGVGAGVAMVAMGEKKQNKRDGAVDNKGRDLEESEISALGEDGIFLPGSPMATGDLPYSREEQAKILGPGFESSDSDEDDVHIRNLLRTLSSNGAAGQSASGLGSTGHKMSGIQSVGASSKVQRRKKGTIEDVFASAIIVDSSSSSEPEPDKPMRMQSRQRRKKATRAGGKAAATRRRRAEKLKESLESSEKQSDSMSGFFDRLRANRPSNTSDTKGAVAGKRRGRTSLNKGISTANGTDRGSRGDKASPGSSNARPIRPSYLHKMTRSKQRGTELASGSRRGSPKAGMAGVAGPITAATSSRPPLRRSGSLRRAGSLAAGELQRGKSTRVNFNQPVDKAVANAAGRGKTRYNKPPGAGDVGSPKRGSTRSPTATDGSARRAALRRSNTGLSRSGTGLTRSTTAATRAGGRTSPSNVTRGKSSSKSPTSTKNRTRINDRAVRAAGRSSQGRAGAKKSSTSSASSGGTRLLGAIGKAAVSAAKAVAGAGATLAKGAASVTSGAAAATASAAGVAAGGIGGVGSAGAKTAGALGSGAAKAAAAAAGATASSGGSAAAAGGGIATAAAGAGATVTNYAEGSVVDKESSSPGDEKASIFGSSGVKKTKSRSGKKSKKKTKGGGKKKADRTSSIYMKPVPVPASRPLTGKAMSPQESTRVMLPPSTSEHRSLKTVDEDATADGAGPAAADNDSADNRAGSNVEVAADAKAAAGGAITADAKITAEQGVDAAEATDSVTPRERPGTATGAHLERARSVYGSSRPGAATKRRTGGKKKKQGVSPSNKDSSSDKPDTLFLGAIRKEEEEKEDGNVV